MRRRKLQKPPGLDSRPRLPLAPGKAGSALGLNCRALRQSKVTLGRQAQDLR